ncbi:glycosyl hydrolase 2 galactose-binding domain-containing protein [Bacteroides sp. 224]|uniref:glycoside hydrolase family 2 protein n=1 Tax=Bacteroides sp. 224 TaxID=2302936 RepID=UPI0013D38484|nr:sugar-binding domain-containing protein [Bacteroides sp. 224]NDV64123.1 glycoside hydrolase family 2 [Bacteroides sp. 224]
MYSVIKPLFCLLLLFLYSIGAVGQTNVNETQKPERLYLDSDITHQGNYRWKMIKAGDVSASGEKISLSGYGTESWLPAIVPGTVLNSLVYNQKYPEPYYGINNKIESKLIPDISETGRDFYTYWFRTDFTVPESFKGKTVWLQVDGINYRAEVWVNGNLLSTINGMFLQDYIDVTAFVKVGKENGLAIKVYPVDVPGSPKPKSWGAVGEFQNGGNGNIGLNTTMLMSVGWDFTFMDGIRDRNTGIWKNISLYATGRVALRHPFVKSELRKPGYDQASETVSVEIINPSTNNRVVQCKVKGEILGENITFEKTFPVKRGEEKLAVFSPKEFPQLVIDAPKLWWPVYKGPQNLYDLKLTVSVDGVACDSVQTRFGIREITSDTKTPDKSRVFYVNGKRLFIRGTNWIPEAMLRTSNERTYAELRYTRQSGINLVRMWGGGIAESDYFFQQCDELGLLVWQEFWMTGDTRHPHDKGLYLSNVESTIKRIRNHPSLAYYVASNESTETTGTPELVKKLDGTLGYQMQSECDGVHDGSPYKQVNPMQHYENTASPRGSRVDGFNPEYGAPTLPTVEILREMMDEKDLWPINKEVWDYLDGNGFHLMSTMYTDLVNNYGKSSSIDEFAKKGQLLGAINSKSIWEVWNYNKLDYGDRFCSGLLFWYHNCPVKQVSSRMWDWSLEPTASLYHTANSLEPLHAQFDYLKNTVSVVNDYYQSFNNYKVTAQVYDINSRKVFEESATVNLPEDGVANDALTIRFPENISQVHFIKLTLKDEKGKEVSSNFYWRSNDKYEGKNTLTGPAASGFEDLSKLKQANVKLSYKVREDADNYFVDIALRNTSNQIAFFNQLQFLNGKKSPIRPSFYTDNFFSMMPGEKKTVTIETAKGKLKDGAMLVLKGWNVDSQEYKLKK